MLLVFPPKQPFFAELSLFTDFGWINSPINDKKEMFGYKKAKNLFEEVAGHSPEEIISKLKNAGSDWIDDKDPDVSVTSY